MKAVRYHEYGTDQVLRIEDTETPTPGHEEVLVKVVATSFNPIHAAMRAGYLQSAFAVDLPHTPGIDVAGTVAQSRSGVTGIEVGDAVVALLPLNADGATAEFELAPGNLLTAAPTSSARTLTASVFSETSNPTPRTADPK
jgi:NADPH:quinone reductase-like Zn-dependent oxidoreductase